MVYESQMVKKMIMRICQIQDRVAEVRPIQKWNDEIQILSAELANSQFAFHDHVKNSDRSREKGVVAKLVNVKDSSTLTA